MIIIYSGYKYCQGHAPTFLGACDQANRKEHTFFYT